MQCGAVQYNTVQCIAVQYSVIQYDAVQYSVVLSGRPPGNIRQWTEWHRMGNRQSYLEEEEIENYLVNTCTYLELTLITYYHI